MRLRWPIAAGVAATLAVPILSTPLSSQGRGADACAIENVERIVAIGDVHGAFDQFVSILKTAGVIDDRERWTGGRTHLVQTGDVLDRGGDSLKAIDLLRKLEPEAARAGGRVHALIGNHEVMRVVGDWRYVSAGEYAVFAARRTIDLDEREREAFRNRPAGFYEMRQQFAANGDYGRWVRRGNSIVRINGILFLHGGISPAVAPFGCAAINETVRDDIAKNFNKTIAGPTKALATREDGPLWYRGLALQPEASFAPEFEKILDLMDARAIVVGHTTVAGAIITRFDKRLFLIDSGMLDGEFYPGGKPAALEIVGGRATAIYSDRREVLTEALGVTTAAAR